MAASRPVVEARSLSAGYGAAPVVRNLDLAVDEGEVVALLGANGAGKTTTLLALSGFVRAMSGEARVLGEHVAGRPHSVARRGLAQVPEGRSVVASLTVRDNLRLGQGDDGRVTRALALFPELDPLLDRRAGLLSGGEQQMLVLGRAMAGRPKALLVDEMSLGLAPLIVDRLLGVLQRAARDAGVAVLFVEQHVHLALRTADRAYVLQHGEVVLTGTGAALLAEGAALEASYFGPSDN